MAILLFLAGGIYVGRSVFPKVDRERVLAQRVEKLSREVAERANSGLGAKVVDAGMKQVPEILQSWHALGAAVPDPLPPAPALPQGGGGNLTVLLLAWQKAPAGAGRAVEAAPLGTLWGRLDPQGALNWAETITDPAELSAAHQGIAKGWAAADASAASEWVATIPEGPERTAVVSAFAKHGAKSAPALALGFALSIDDAAVRSEIVHAVLREAAQLPLTEVEVLVRAADVPPAELADYLARSRSLQTTGGDQP